MKRTLLFIICVAAVSIVLQGQSQPREKVRIGIAGLTHSHVLPLLRNYNNYGFELAGIYESNKELAERYAAQYRIDRNIIYSSLEEMLDKSKPDGVVTFTSIYDHLAVVEACAPRGIHVMVEKPLAVNSRHADKMEALAVKHKILLLTNYETTWYSSNQKCFEMVSDGVAGPIRKIIVYDGHKGPKEINVNSEFLEWLADPTGNGGGAVIDFGCYGANLVTWLLNGQEPEYVYAVLKQYKPGTYPKVDDDATIVLSYPSMEGVIHASWNWPFNRKDMHIYGTTGYIFSDDSRNVRYRLSEKEKETVITVPSREKPYNDPFNYFESAVKGEIQVTDNDLSSLRNNMIVVRILDAARKSHRTGKRIKL